jgi:hypothetical protein
VKEAGRDLAQKRASSTVPVEVSVDAVREHLGKPDVKEAVTPEQAAKELSSARVTAAKFVEGTNLSNIAEQVDKARAEVIKTNPKAAEELGLSAEDVEAAKKADGEKPAEERPDTAAKPDQPARTQLMASTPRSRRR